VVDYHKSTGSSGTMRIRDLGTTVEFWITSGNDTTWHQALPWRYTVNGSTSSWQSTSYDQGQGYKKLASFQVNTTQTVTFYLGDTDTSGFGGPTTFNQLINRASAPSTPGLPTLSSIGSTSIHVAFTDGANNGATIDSREIAYDNDNTIAGAANTGNIGTDKAITVTGLTPGTTYWFWARAHNSQGWSPWSGARSATTLRVPDAPTPPTISEITQISAKATWTPNGNGGSAITGYDIGWGTNSTTPISVEAATSPRTISSLSPGTTYYVFARAKNAVGTGPWSIGTSMRTIAGVRVNVSGVWREAIPYVKVAGVWRIARPWARIAGVWKETI
jgi:hypothetical protein